MVTRNIRIVLSYDGTNFCGWQSQPSGRSVQDAVETALEKLHGHSMAVRVAGRTDSGVHADGQVINFRSDGSIPTDRFVRALNQHLPWDIRALGSDEVGEDFDSRLDARVRVYKYFVESREVRRPSTGRFVWTLPYRLETARLNEYAARLIGTHDFSTFAAAGDTSVSKTRRVYSAGFYIEGSQLVFKIAANAFLYRMVRSLVGTMIELGHHELPVDEMRERLQARNRKAAGRTAPPWGLFLHKVLYDERKLY